LVLPQGADDIARATCSARTIAILIPNVQGIRNNTWQTYLTTVNAIEALTGYDFFSNLPEAVQNCIEAGTDGTNPPGTANQSAATAEDTAATITLQAVRPNNNNLTFSIVGGGPQHGTLGSVSAASCTGGDCTATVTYTPGPDYNGADSFNFKVNNGSADSNVSTVSLNVTEVNDAPVAANDTKVTNQNAALTFPASDLTTNDSSGPTNETGQTLAVTSVTATPDTHGTVTLSSGLVTYTPATNYGGPASFSYQVCDNGMTNGAPDSKCATASVNVTVINNPPTIAGATISRQQGTSGTVSVIATVSDDFTAAGNLTVTVTSAPTGITVGPLTNTNGTITANVAAACNAAIGTNTVGLQVTDSGGLTTTASLTVNVIANAPPTVTITGPASGSIYPVGTAVSFTGSFTDAPGGTHTATWTFDNISQAGTVNETTGDVTASYTFTQAGVYLLKLTVNDGCGASGTTTTVGEFEALVVVYDPNSGWVTGGGWINSPAGAYVPNPSLTGKANFGFVSKYENGQSVPTGNTEFHFKAGDLKFKSTSYEWLVISGGKKAQYKGSGTINGSGDYRFMLTAIDGDQPGGGGQDKFRLRIWSDGGGVVYDNQFNAPDSDDPTTVLGGGSIVIHK
jgi:hypothetical protein